MREGRPRPKAASLWWWLGHSCVCTLPGSSQHVPAQTAPLYTSTTTCARGATGCRCARSVRVSTLAATRVSESEHMTRSDDARTAWRRSVCCTWPCKHGASKKRVLQVQTPTTRTTSSRRKCIPPHARHHVRFREKQLLQLVLEPKLSGCPPNSE